MTSTRNATASSLPSQALPPGFWQREASHYPQPLSPMCRTTFLPIVNAGLRLPFAEFSLLVERVEFQEIRGWVYVRVIPLGGKDRKPLPAWLMPLLIRIVPRLRRRIAGSVTAIRADKHGRMVERWHTEWKPELIARLDEVRGVDLTALTDAALAEHLDRAVALLARGVDIHFLLHGALAMVLGELAFTCRDLLGWDQAQTLILLSGLSEQSTAPARRLRELAQRAQQRPVLRDFIEHAEHADLPRLASVDPEFAAAFSRYLDEFGYRTLRYELADPAINETPALIFSLIRDQIRRSYLPDADAAALEQQRTFAVSEARAIIARRPGAERESRPAIEKHRAADRERFERALERGTRAYGVREENEAYTTSMPLAAVRFALLEAGRRLMQHGVIEQRDDIFFLELEEARTALAQGGDQRSLVQRRHAERTATLTHPGPASYGKDPGPPPSLAALPAEARFAMEAFVWYYDHIVAAEESNREQSAGTLLHGTPAAPGQYAGPARVITGEDEFDKIQPGDVLVCPITSPVWSVLFPSVGALVTDTGGILSHPAIIAREYRIPAVVATGNATRLLRDGQIVTVDGAAGTVEVRS